jgi:hypothetical protein
VRKPIDMRPILGRQERLQALKRNRGVRSSKAESRSRFTRTSASRPATRQRLVCRRTALGTEHPARTSKVSSRLWRRLKVSQLTVAASQAAAGLLVQDHLPFLQAVWAPQGEVDDIGSADQRARAEGGAGLKPHAVLTAAVLGLLVGRMLVRLVGAWQFSDRRTRRRDEGKGRRAGRVSSHPSACRRTFDAKPQRSCSVR